MSAYDIHYAAPGDIFRLQTSPPTLKLAVMAASGLAIRNPGEVKVFYAKTGQCILTLRGGMM